MRENRPIAEARMGAEIQPTWGEGDAASVPLSWDATRPVARSQNAGSTRGRRRSRLKHDEEPFMHEPGLLCFQMLRADRRWFPNHARKWPGEGETW